MARPTISVFNGGEISPLAMGRVDLAVFRTCLKELVNYLPSVEGGAYRRPGTVHAGSTKTAAERSWFLGFRYPDGRGYVFELGNGYIRFWTEHGVLLSGGSPLEVPTALAIGDLTDADGCLRVQFEQSNDVVYLVHPSVFPIKVVRTSVSTFTLGTHGPSANEWGQPPSDQRAFEDTNIDQSLTIRASANGPAGTAITLTAAGFSFQPADSQYALYLEDRNVSAVKAWEAAKVVAAADVRRVDQRVYTTAAGGTTGTVRPSHTIGTKIDGDPGVSWAYNDAGYGVVVLGTIASPSATATATIASPLPSNIVGVGNATYRWAMQAFRSSAGFPRAVAIWRERLWYAKGARLYGSVLGDFDNFERRRAGVVEADSAIVLDIPSEVLWLLPTKKGLVVGTAAREYRLAEASATEIFGPLNYSLDEGSEDGCGAPQPVRAGSGEALFVNAARTKLHELAYQIEVDGLSSVDRTQLANHILKAGAIQLAWQKAPHPMLWVLLADGTLRSMTLNSAERVYGWARHSIAGVVESVAVCPTPDRKSEEVWVQVRRVINGATVRHVEYLEQPFSAAAGLASAHFLDAGLSFVAVTPISTLSGLSHLEGQTVSLLVNGKVQADRVVSAGQITVPSDVANAVYRVGLGYTSSLVTTPIDVGGVGGTMQGLKNAAKSIWLRFLETLGGWVGVDGREMFELQFTSTEDVMDQAPAPFTGLKRIGIDGGSDPEVCIRVEQRQALPMTVLALIPNISAKGEG